MPRIKFIYEKKKNTNIDQNLFKLNRCFYTWVFHKKKINLFFWSKTGNEMVIKRKKFTIIYHKNFYILKNFKQVMILNVFRFKVFFNIILFCLIVNTSQLDEIGNTRQNFLTLPSIISILKISICQIIF